MMKNEKCTDKQIRRVIELAKELLLCADQGDDMREDDGCGVLYAIVRDCAYRIENAALREKEVHTCRGNR